jgi:hypothetical protein
MAVTGTAAQNMADCHQIPPAIGLLSFNETLTVTPRLTALLRYPDGEFSEYGSISLLAKRWLWSKMLLGKSGTASNHMSSWRGLTWTMLSLDLGLVCAYSRMTIQRGRFLIGTGHLSGVTEGVHHQNTRMGCPKTWDCFALSSRDRLLAGRAIQCRDHWCALLATGIVNTRCPDSVRAGVTARSRAVRA